jgi:hypothetical protein
MHFIRPAILLLLACIAVTGCVTANRAEVTVRLRDNSDGTNVNDCLLLVIHGEALDSSGRWWVVQETQVGATAIKSARVELISSGQALKQKGYVAGLAGPYTVGTPETWEYWVFRRGYQPDDFLDQRLTNRHENNAPLIFLMLRIDPGKSYSDEMVLEASRKLVDVRDLLPPDAMTARLVNLAILQLKDVRLLSFKREHRSQADEMLATLETYRASLPAELRNQAPAEAPYTLPERVAPIRPTSRPASQPASQPTDPISLTPPPPAATEQTPPSEPPAPIEAVPAIEADLPSSAPAPAETQPAPLPAPPEAAPAGPPTP